MAAPRRSDEAERLVRTTEEALDAGIARSGPGGACPTSATRSSRWPSAPGLGMVREYGGHGIGRALHEDPFIPNYGEPGRGPEMRPGLVVAIEPMVNAGGEDDPRAATTGGRS